MDEKTIARFWSKVDKSAPEPRPGLGPCWLWLGSLDTHGYGHLAVDGKLTLAHRLSFRLIVKKPGNALVLHKCDVRHCVNPGHLFVGDYAANMRDAVTKGRLKPPPKGIAHNRSKLDPDKVREIRKMAAAGVPKAQIARHFGVWPRAVWMILEGKSWKDVA